MSNVPAALNLEIAAALSASDLPANLVHWLTRLNTLLGVPLHHLISDERLLEPESIKFFQLDPSWMEALIDGALSIGRHYTEVDSVSPSLIAEQVHLPHLHTAVQNALPEMRRRQLKKMAKTSSTTEDQMVTGFFLRSKVVSGWKSLDVIGYSQGSSPNDYERGKITSAQVPLEILRLETLSPTLLFGLFQGQLYQLVLHQPPEAIHFGFQSVSLQANRATKNLRTPTKNWDAPDTSYDLQNYQNQQVEKIFRERSSRVINMFQLSQLLATKLNAVDKAPGYYQAAPTENYQDHLLSSDFALEMVQGVGLVSFVNDIPPK